MVDGTGRGGGGVSVARAAVAIGGRDLVRQWRQPSRIVASVVTPLMVWAFFVGGFSGALGDGGFTAQIVPGVATLTVMFSTIFTSISLIQDRHDGFLRAALVSPAPPMGIVLGKVGAGSLIATLQGCVVLLVLPVLDPGVSVVGLLGAACVLMLVSVMLIGLGLSLAWRIDSTQGFHGVMNGLLMPMWITSGAVFPVNDAADWLRWVALVNPMTWMHDAMRGALGSGTIDGAPGWVAWGVSGSSSLLMLLVSAWVMGRRARRV